MYDSFVIDRKSSRFAKPAEVTALSSLLCAVPMLLIGCADQPGYGEAVSAVTVAGTVSSGCSTAVVLGLSRQIADEIGCEHPNGLVSFSGTSGVTLTSSAVLPYLEQDAASDLSSVAANSSLQVNSAFRTIAQQYLLYRWYQAGSCGIAAAATVGNSNHESGRAIDLANWSSRVSAMSAHGWAHDVPGDSVHFDHTRSSDIRGQDTKAFQTLWNRNHPEDPISVDGSYGPQTEARLKMSPATGFAIGASCVTTPHAQISAVDGPDRVMTRAQAHYTLSLTNGTTSDWPDTAQLVVASGSQLYDPSWQSQTEIVTLGAPILAGQVGTVDIDVTTPAVTEDTAITQVISIQDGATTLGTISLSLTVVAQASAGDSPTQSDDGGDSHDLGEVTGGCNAGGGSAGALVMLALVSLRRRRARSAARARSTDIG